jgi:hypothetical protein
MEFLAGSSSPGQKGNKCGKKKRERKERKLKDDLGFQRKTKAAMLTLRVRRILFLGFRLRMSLNICSEYRYPR